MTIKVVKSITLIICLSSYGLLIGWWTLTTAAAAPPQQTGNGLTSPLTGDTLSGVVEITGTASHPQFLRYELSFYQEAQPGAGWIVFAEGERPVNDNILAFWDTTVGRQSGAPVFPDGAYRLRLRVVRQDYNYDEYFVTDLIVSNDSPTPTPTITPTATLDPAATPTTVAAVAPTIAPELLPSLTPFPTPSPPATPINSAANPAATRAAEENEGLAAQVEALDFGQVVTAAQLGIVCAFGAFVLLGIYLVLRAIGRRLWKLFIS